MNTLPDQTSSSSQTQPDPQQSSVVGATAQRQQGSIVSSGGKEIEGVSAQLHEELRDATGQEFELPKEVSAIGVTMQPTTIPIPAPVAKMGVKPLGNNVLVQTKSAVVLPLSDEQIAKGLHQGVTESIRWLSEWCVRRLKHLHITLKNVQGSLVRVKE